MKGKGQDKLGNPSPKAPGGDFYAGGKSEVASEAKDKSEGFKRGGKVMSSANSGTPRSKSSHY